MIFDLIQIKKLRKQYSLSQKELAEKAGVSQSLIAKIESQRIDPAYSNAKKIFQALEELRDSQEPKAIEVMNKKVLFANIQQSLGEVVKIMKEKNISQMPVKSQESVVGVISESIIINALAKYKDKFANLKVGDVMQDTPPIVSVNEKYSNLVELLRTNQIVLISDRGMIKGLVSKSDLLGLF
ncbi:MAG: CBS domain-containing protein [Nanoarchaeota archaeon]|nr:CBS domain-containing protein [Nanoarchaeota archaeon]